MERGGGNNRKSEELERRRRLIEKLLTTGAVNCIRYDGGTPARTYGFWVEIGGPSFGTHVRKNSGDALRAPTDSPELPDEVITAFDGFLESADGIVELLGDVAFVEKLGQHQKIAYAFFDVTVGRLTIVAL